MKWLAFAVGLLAIIGCAPKEKSGSETTSQPTQTPVVGNTSTPNHSGSSGGQTLAMARQGFKSKLTGHKANEPVEEPPAKLVQTVQYSSPVGKLAAYLTPNPNDGKKHPAIIWITGGDCNSIGDVWSPPERNNDQSARQYREAGVVMMFPSLRGGNENPGVQEGFLGEVDDVLAAADYLVKQDYVDPKRIYLGGHSTGGTLVLLVAESTNLFRAVFSFGPVDNVGGYPPIYTPFNRGNPREIELRSPGRWLHCIACPTFVFEGAREGNIDSLQQMADASRNPKAHFHSIPGETHFSILGPTNRLVAQKILGDAGPETNISFNEAELIKPFRRR